MVSVPNIMVKENALVELLEIALIRFHIPNHNL